MQLTSATDRAGLAEDQAALRRVATLVARGVRPAEIFSAVSEEIGRLFRAEQSAVARFEPDGSAVVVGAGAGTLGVSVGSRRTLEDLPASAAVYRTGRPARNERSGWGNASGHVAEARREMGLVSNVAAPIVVKGHLWGVLTVSAARESFPPDAEERLETFTELVATAIANAETHAELTASEARAHALASEQAALRRVATLVAEGATATELCAAVAREVAEVLGIPTVTVDRYEADGSSTVMAAWGHGGFPAGSRWPLDGTSLVGTVLATGSSARIDDYSELSGAIASVVQEGPFVTTVGVPIVVDGALWGAICVGTTRVEDMPADTEARLAGFTELVATAIANTTARDALRRLADEQAALRRVATLVAQGPTATELFAAVAHEVADVLGFGTVTVDRYESDGTSTVIAAWGQGAFPVGSRWPLDGPSLVGNVLATGRAARIDDYSELAEAIGFAVDEVPFVSAVGVPIVVDGALWGAICVGTTRVEDMPADTESRLAGFTELVATAIANAESHSDLAASEARARALAQEQSALRRVATLVAEGASAIDVFTAVTKEVAGMFDAAATSLSRYEGDCCVVVATCRSGFPVGSRWPLDLDSLASRVLATNRPVYVDDYSDIARQLPDAHPVRPADVAVGVPIVVEGNLWGVLCVGAPELSSALSETVDRISSFAELAATAIGNTDARENVGRLIDEQTALRRVATLVAENASAETLFTAVAEEVARVLGVPSVTIDRFDQDGSATTVVAWWSAEGQLDWPVGSRWPLNGPSVAARIWETGRPAMIDDYTGLRGSIAAVFRDRPRARAVGVPIVVGNRLWGMIGVGSIEDDVPEAVEDRLARFTELVASAIANSENRAELSASEARARELANEQAALRRVATLVAQGASPDALFSAVAEEVAGLIGIPVVGVYRYETDKTFTTLGLAGDRKLAVGSRWPVVEEGLAGKILATGRPARKDDYSTMPGPLGSALREDQIDSAAGVPIMVDGGIWGFMAATCRPGESIPADTEQHLERFTELVATGVSNATVRADLIASRARVVSAADETRRRLERDLHDGIQQWLVALALRARKAARFSAEGESAVRELSGLADDLVAVTDELRELSRGIHPAILSDAGLDDALAALARRSAIPVELEVGFQGRYDATVEATVYYVAAESITNAVKHARASVIRVRGGWREGAIELEITDDGVGGADPRRGTGLLGLKDRVDTLGGTISFASAAGAGTTIRVRLPACPRDEEDPPLPRSDEGASAPASG